MVMKEKDLLLEEKGKGLETEIVEMTEEMKREEEILMNEEIAQEIDIGEGVQKEVMEMIEDDRNDVRRGRLFFKNGCYSGTISSF